MYPKRLTVESTRRCVSRPTLPVLFRTLDTVAVETPAAWATCLMVTLMLCVLPHLPKSLLFIQSGENDWTQNSRSVAQTKKNLTSRKTRDKRCDTQVKRLSLVGS